MAPEPLSPRQPRPFSQVPQAQTSGRGSLSLVQKLFQARSQMELVGPTAIVSPGVGDVICNANPNRYSLVMQVSLGAPVTIIPQNYPPTGGRLILLNSVNPLILTFDEVGPLCQLGWVVYFVPAGPCEMSVTEILASQSGL